MNVKDIIKAHTKLTGKLNKLQEMYKKSLDACIEFTSQVNRCKTQYFLSCNDSYRRPGDKHMQGVIDTYNESLTECKGLLNSEIRTLKIIKTELKSVKNQLANLSNIDFKK